MLIQELAQTLKKKGHSVTILTGFPNYPSGRIYPGYRVRLMQREVLSGLPLIRVALYPEHSRSGLKRALNYMSFALSSALLGFFVVSKPDVIFVYHPPLTVGLPAFILSRLWGVPFIYQIQDLWPETLRATGMLSSKRILKIVGRFAQWVYKKAYKILVISPGFRTNLLEKGVPADKIRVISNWVDSSVYEYSLKSQELAEELGLTSGINILYAGNIGAAQGLETAVEAAALLSDIPTLRFIFIGDGVSLHKLQIMVTSKGLENVRFIGRYPHKDMPRLFALADGLLIHLKDDPLFRITIPSKTMAYFASGKPIIAAVTGDVADLITSVGAGIVCQPGDPQSLADCIRHFIKMSADQRQKMGERGLNAARSQFSRVLLIGEIEKEMFRALEC